MKYDGTMQRSKLGISAASAKANDRKRFLWIVAALILTYCMYLPMHYGMDTFACEDTYRAIDSVPREERVAAAMGDAMGSGFGAGRYTRGALFLLFAAVGKVQWLILPWANIVALIFMCLAACATWKMLQEHDVGRNNILIFPCFLIAFCQPFFTDWLQFSECQIYYPLGLYLAVLAAKIAFRPCADAQASRWSGAVRWLVGLVLLLLAAGLYQITMQWFVLLACIVIVQESVAGENDSWVISIKNMGKKICAGSLIYGATALVQLLVTRVIFQNTRVTQVPLQQRWDAVLQAQKHLWGITPYTGNRWSLLFVLLVILLFVLLLMVVTKSRISFGQKATRILVALVCVVAVHVSMFLPLFFSELWFPPRSLVGFWGVPLLLAASTKMKTGKKKFKGLEGLAALIAVALVAVNIFTCISIGRGIYKVNDIDLARAQQIEDVIANYERESGETVEYLAFHHDVQPIYGYGGVFFTHENNGAAWSRTWNFLPLMRKISGKSYRQLEYSDAQFAAVYGSVNWNEFDTAQVRFEGKVAYIAVY